MSLVEWLAENAGQMLVIGVPLGVASISAYAMVKAKRNREPVPIPEVWKENRLSRQEADDARDANALLERKVTNQGTALIVLWDYVQRLLDRWGEPTAPRLSRSEKAIIERVIEDVNTPPEGVPMQDSQLNPS